MEKEISAAEAKRRFSTVLRQVRAGHSYVVTNRGRPVAPIRPVVVDEGSDKAKAALLAHLRKQAVRDIGRWTRDELYD